MKGLEEMIKKVKKSMEGGKTVQEVHDDLQAQGVDLELLHYAVKAAIMESRLNQRPNKNDNG